MSECKADDDPVKQQALTRARKELQAHLPYNPRIQPKAQEKGLGSQMVNYQRSKDRGI